LTSKCLTNLFQRVEGHSLSFILFKCQSVVWLTPVSLASQSKDRFCSFNSRSIWTLIIAPYRTIIARVICTINVSYLSIEYIACLKYITPHEPD